MVKFASEARRECVHEPAQASLKAVVAAAAGAGLGVVGGVAAVKAAALSGVLLPVTLGLWAVGITSVAIGVTFGVCGKRGL